MKAQKWLNAFVRFVAFLERVGNALGTLAFIWATVVVLGGFITNLTRKDFGFATAIVFLEAFRAFSRQSVPDDQLLFKTTGGIKLKRVSLRGGSLYYVNAVIMTLCLCLIPGYLLIDRYIHFLRNYHAFFFLPLLALVSSMRFYHFIMFLSKPGSPKLLQFSPFAALLAVYVLLSLFYSPDKALSWRAYLIIPQWFIVYLLARVHYYPGTARAHRGLRKKLTMAVEVLRIVFLASIILTLSTWWLWLAKVSFSQRVSTWYPLLLLGLLGAPVLGNLQTLVALARILLACRGLIERTDLVSSREENTHVLAALRVLYIMVLVQGILYMTACILESCSTLLRRSVALGCGLVDTLGWESVNLYCQHAYDKFLQESVFDATEINLSTFAVHSLSCDVSRDKKLAALGILHSFLRQEASNDSKTKTKLVSEITTSTKAVTSLISMLGWTVPQVAETRMLAAKVTAHLAPYLQVVQIPGTVQMVSTLIDEETQQSQIMDTNSGENHGVDIGEEDYDSSTWAASMSSQIRRLWQHLNILRSIPHDGPKGVDDSLPALGMLILQGLAHNPDNCIEISTATDLIPKIIGSMSCTTNTMTPKQKQIVTTASLTLVAKLASVKGKVGVVLRQEMCENPFLLSNLASTMENSSSGSEQLKPAMDIIAKLAVDTKTRQEIGRIQVIMHKLVQEFLRRDESFKTLRTAAGEALAMLAMESVDNCRAILVQDRPEYNLMDNLQAMLHECLYPAAGLLQSLCAYCGDELRRRGQSNSLSSTLEVVLGKIMDARGKQMEALVGLALEICKLFLSERITPALGSCTNIEAFVQKLVSELNAHKKPSPEFPSMRRLLVELTICMAQSYPSYADTFKKYGMTNALSQVENTPSKVESYRVFFGSVGVVSQEGFPLSVLVARAKELVRGSNS